MNRLRLAHSLVRKKFVGEATSKMCMVSVWIKKDRGEENLLKEVAFIRSKGRKLILSTLWGEEKSVEAKIEEIDFVNSKVLLE
jgi:predicted RNA-binding protein